MRDDVGTARRAERTGSATGVARGAAETLTIKSRSQMQLIWLRFRKHRMAMSSLWVLVVYPVFILFGEFFVPFMRLNPAADPNAVREMERWKAEGFRGIKIHPEIQRFGLDAPGLDEFFAAAAELRLPVVSHTGVLHGRFPPSRYRPELFERFVAEQPDLTLILAHAGGAAYFRQALSLMQSYPNTYADLTCTLRPGLPWYIPAGELYLIRDVGLRGRLIYGADWPWGGTQHVLSDLEALRNMEFDAEERADVLGGTIARILGISP